MTAYNEHTGDALRSKAASDNFRNNYDAIFGKKNKPQEEKVIETDEKRDTIQSS